MTTTPTASHTPPQRQCAEGEIRTHTGNNSQRFLRPPRLPFRHFGKCPLTPIIPTTRVSVNVGSVVEAGLVSVGGFDKGVDSTPVPLWIPASAGMTIRLLQRFRLFQLPIRRTGLSGFRHRIEVRGRLYAGMTVCGRRVGLFTAQSRRIGLTERDKNQMGHFGSGAGGCISIVSSIGGLRVFTTVFKDQVNRLS